MIGENKIGRNDPCPCGSGIKYKKCHGRKDSSFPQYDQVYDPKSLGSLPPHILQAIKERQQNMKTDKPRYGYIRPIISKIAQGMRLVGVGSSVYYTEANVTFHDFLIRFLGSCLGKEWCNLELRKAYDIMHPIAQWYLGLITLKKGHFVPGKAIQSAEASGSAGAIISLAYDLYVLRDNALLQNRFISRLKDRLQFQGARYEAYVTACFLKAGFEIAPENESDTSITHCEFSATDNETGVKYSVEAKSRHRPGFLGFKGKRQDFEAIKLGIRGLLLDALGKHALYTRVIFIDINMPPEDTSNFDTSWFSELATEIANLESEGYSAPAYIFFTNHPYHYVGENELEPKKDFLMTAINIPDFKRHGVGKTKDIDPTISRLFDSILEHSTIPIDFG
jgi:hypothetical protein